MQSQIHCQDSPLCMSACPFQLSQRCPCFQRLCSRLNLLPLPFCNRSMHLHWIWDQDGGLLPSSWASSLQRYCNLLYLARRLRLSCQDGVKTQESRLRFGLVSTSIQTCYDIVRVKPARPSLDFKFKPQSHGVVAFKFEIFKRAIPDQDGGRTRIDKCRESCAASNKNTCNTNGDRVTLALQVLQYRSGTGIPIYGIMYSFYC